ncbi:uncharacterized protein LOC124445640 [Xenia sp. Carnegie-2017]|uniref:uncharacterized protein LOC124445640 n=1 Tax=Xenia sp. Carnegie-2017 TaxID=2897299 RepID=UPI001F034574|nr:uncharacterized protein LOC124445640 [Xenia sp. Carnegie-2017]
MPVYDKIHKNNTLHFVKRQCDGYFGCDYEDSFQSDDKALLEDNASCGKPSNILPWVKRKSPPVMSFLKKIASLKKKNRSATKERNTRGNGQGYHTLPNRKTKDLDDIAAGYRSLLYGSSFKTLKRDHYCDGYFGCPPVLKN